MKMIKKLTTLCIALFILFTCAIPTMAQGENAQTEGPKGTITYNTGTHNVDGKEFKIYRLMDATVDPNTQAKPDGSNPLVAYKISSKFKGFFTEDLLSEIADSEGKKTLDLKAQEYLKENVSKSEFHNKLKDYINKQGALVEADLTFNVTNGTYTTGQLPYGYYVIIPAEELKLGLSFTTLHTASQKVYLKGVQPGVDKTINGLETDSAQIGDTITFTVKSTVPNMTGFDAYTFKLVDTLSKGLTFDRNSVKVTITGVDKLDPTPQIEVTDKTADINPNNEGKTKFEIDFQNIIAFKEHANKEIVFTYNAILNENAVIDGEGNTNSAQVVYGNNGEITSGPDVATVYTHKLTIKKQDRNEIEGVNMLAGAEFQIIRKKAEDPQDDIVKFIKSTVTEGTYRVATKEEIVKEPKPENLVDTVISPQNGTIVINGLDAATYIVKEIKAPAGYNKLKQPEEHTITFNSDKNQAENVELTVVNKPGTLLPETGGMGTVVFTVVGVVGILAVAYSFMPKKSKNK